MDPEIPGYIVLDADHPEKGPGTYVLIFDIEEDMESEIGALGRIPFSRGTYAYVGSAKAGLWGRVKRHLGDPGKKRWHIDHLASLGKNRRIIWKVFRKGDECRTAENLNSKYPGIPGFGCSDCGCGSHLFFMGSREDEI